MPIVILIIVVGILIVAGGIWYYEACQSTKIPNQPQAALQATSSVSSSVSSSTLYENTRLGYSLAIPAGYRLASHYMQFLNSIDIAYGVKDYSDDNAYGVLITAASEDQEISAVDALEKQYESLDKNSDAYSTFVVAARYDGIPLLHKSIFIYPSTGSLDSLKETLANPPPGTHPPTSFTERTVGSQEAIRYSTGVDERFEVVAVSFNAQTTLGSGYPIRTITFEMPQDVFDEAAFDAVVISFYQ